MVCQLQELTPIELKRSAACNVKGEYGEIIRKDKKIQCNRAVFNNVKNKL